MLTMTDTAAEVIHEITVNHGAPGDHGLRITPEPQPDGAAFAIALAPGPAPEDTVVEARDGDAQIYLEPGAEAMLHDKLLDVEISEEGEVVFLFTSQHHLSD